MLLHALYIGLYLHTGILTFKRCIIGANLSERHTYRVVLHNLCLLRATYIVTIYSVPVSVYLLQAKRAT